MDKACMHLTNYSMNRFSEGYVQADGSVEGADSGSKWTFATLRWMEALSILPAQPGSHSLAWGSSLCYVHCLAALSASGHSPLQYFAFARTALLGNHAHGCN